MTRSITYVLTHLAYGGAETQVVELCRHVAGLGWQVSVISLMPPSGLTERLDQLGVPWSHLGVDRGEHSPRIVTGLRRQLSRLAPTVIHSHTLPANFAARAVRPLLRRHPVLVTSAHNVWEGDWKRMLFYRLTDRVADLTTNCSIAAVERYVRIKAAPAHRIRYMPNGIDTDRFRPDPAIRNAKRGELGLGDAFTWLAVGRMTEQKDWPNVLEGARQALGAGDRLLIVGDGELKGAVEQGIRDRGLEDRVQHLGTRTDIPELMCAADGYLMGSAWEGLPIVLLEASAAGLPIVATDVGGNDQLVRPGQTGWLVQPRDPEALAEGMSSLRELDPSVRARLGAAARDHVSERYSMAAIAARWVAIYEELLAKRAA
ncbi:MAG TPA: glycosyltransferase [Deltaproteobacteria bacterium]|nr:glycosyltransferase [Deltaproteobacteria bacterium]